MGLLNILSLLLVACTCINAVPVYEVGEDKSVLSAKLEKDDLKTDASSYYSGTNWGSPSSSYGGNGVTGYGLIGSSGYDNSYYNSYPGRQGYGLHGYGPGGNGGYGGYGGNGGINSYYGYRNPYYQGHNQLGFGYYDKRSGYGNIYNGITPSLVTGYRGYSRR